MPIKNVKILTTGSLSPIQDIVKRTCNRNKISRAKLIICQIKLSYKDPEQNMMFFFITHMSYILSAEFF